MRRDLSGLFNGYRRDPVGEEESIITPIQRTALMSAKNTTKGKQAKTPIRRMCGAMEVHMRLVESDPDMRKRRAQIHAQTDTMIARGAAFKRVAAKKVPVTIPVVVH